MVAKYCSKREKSQEAKWRSAVEWRPVCKLERVMDVDLFLEMQGKWPEDSPHYLVILHEMFCHAALEGQKEAEQFIHQGCQQHMPQLNPKAGIPAVELVGMETSREELLEIYFEVYKLHRSPGSPPEEPAIAEEVLAAVPDHLQERGEAPEAQAQPTPGDSHPSNRRPHQEWENLIDRSLARMCKAHQQALSTTMALEEEIERLGQMRACSQSRMKLRSQDRQRSKGEGQKKRHCQVSFADKPAPNQSADPEMPSGEEGSEGRDSDLGGLPELKPVVASFLQGSPETLDDEGEDMPLEPTVLDFAKWVHWKVEKCNTPSWWMKLWTVPGEDNTRKLARQVRASFKLPQWLQELDAERATLQAPPVLPCLCQQRFMLLADSIFASQDIREGP